MISWEMISKASAWLKIEENIRQEILAATGVDFPDKIQGMDKLYDFLEANQAIVSFLSDKFLAMFTAKK